MIDDNEIPLNNSKLVDENNHDFLLDLTPRQQFGSEFVVLARRWRQALDDNLAQMGLSDATWSPLFHLSREAEGISQKELAARVGLNGSSLVRLIDILVDKGFVERKINNKDRRINHVMLTPEGHKAIIKIREFIFNLDAQMLEDVSDDEILFMLKVIKKIDARIKIIKSKSQSNQIKNDCFNREI